MTTQTIESRDEAMRMTVAHVNRVGTLIAEAIGNLAKRSAVHDQGKFGTEEWPTFARITHDLHGITYGSDEYKAQLAKHKPAIEHHQVNNSHHPEFYAGDVSRMSLLDLLEMACDWKAAGERHADGSFTKSITHNTTRFNLSPQLVGILEATGREMGWIQ